MTIALAFSNNKLAVQDTQKTYQENVLYVSTFCASVMASKLPALNSYPSNWAEIEAAYVQANADALGWANTVLARLLETPVEIDDYNNAVTMAFNDAIANAQALISNPGNASAKSALLANLATLSQTVGLMVSSVEGAIARVAAFNNNVPDMATQFATIIQGTIDATDADQTQINNLNQAIDNLSEQIKDYWVTIGALTGAIVVEGTLATLATIIAWPEGSVAWLIFGPAILIEGAMIALDAKNIYDAYEAIQQDTQKITGLTADMAALSATSQQYTEFANQTTAIQDSLNAILAAWQSVDEELTAAVNEINDASDDYDDSDWQAVVNDLNAGLGDWNEAYQLSQALTLNLTGTTAQLSYGMTQAQAQAAVNAGTSLPLLEYINRL